MATRKVVYRCGCTFKTSELEEAERHADAESHKLVATGVINPSSDSEKD